MDTDMILFYCGEIEKNLAAMKELREVPVGHHTISKIELSVEQIVKIIEEN